MSEIPKHLLEKAQQTDRWAVYDNEEVLARALALARGIYQRLLVLGYASLSGSTLRGRAKVFGLHYRRSARSLLARLRAAGLASEVRTRPHGRRVLVIYDTLRAEDDAA